jgi:type IV pilus assembly protein PilB
VMPITETMQDMILKSATALEISRESVKNGVRDLRQSGLLKVKAGITSIDEVLGCTNE